MAVEVCVCVCVCVRARVRDVPWRYIDGGGHMCHGKGLSTLMGRLWRPVDCLRPSAGRLWRARAAYGGRVTKVTEAFLTYVAIDEAGRPRPLPPEAYQ